MSATGNGVRNAAETFHCWICNRRAPVLFRTKMDEWLEQAPSDAEFELRQERFVFKPRLACRECLDGFVTVPGTITAFFEHNGVKYRLSRVHKQVEYDLAKWTAYVQRYGAGTTPDAR